MEDIKEVALPEELKAAIRDYRACSTRELKAHMEMIERMWADSISLHLAELQKDATPVAYMTYKGHLLHANDPKVSEHSEPTPLFDHPQPKAATVPQGWEASLYELSEALDILARDYDTRPERGMWNAFEYLRNRALSAAPSLPAQSEHKPLQEAGPEDAAIYQSIADNYNTAQSEGEQR